MNIGEPQKEVFIEDPNATPAPAEPAREPIREPVPAGVPA